MSDNNNKRQLYIQPLLSGIDEIRDDLETNSLGGQYSYGLELLDDAVNGIRKGSVTFIIAAPNTGKSLFCLRIASNIAKAGGKVLVCSCEMGAGLILERELKHLCNISMYELRKTYKWDARMADNILYTLGTDNQYEFLKNIDIVETAGATVYDIVELLKKTHYDFIVVDYIQRIKGRGTDYEVISEAASVLQTYARESKVPLLIASQASRQSVADAQSEKVIDMTRIKGKGSGSIEEDGDVGMSLLESTENGTRFLLAYLFKNRYGSFKNIMYKYKLSPRLDVILVEKDV